MQARSKGVGTRYDAMWFDIDVVDEDLVMGLWTKWW